MTTQVHLLYPINPYADAAESTDFADNPFLERAFDDKFLLCNPLFSVKSVYLFFQAEQLRKSILITRGCSGLAKAPSANPSFSLRRFADIIKKGHLPEACCEILSLLATNTFP